MSKKYYRLIVTLLTIATLVAVLTAYYNRFPFKGNEIDIAHAISLELRKEIALIEMQELNGHLIAFYRDSSSSQN
jgi:hypothetical protein